MPHGELPARLTRAQIARAVPGGSRRARDQRSWLRSALAAIEAEHWYVSRKNSTAAIARQLCLHMDWRLGTSRPGHDRMARRAPGRRADGTCSTDTVRRAIRWLESAGLVGCVSPGTTADVRSAVLYAGSGNLAAVYVLCLPRKRSALPRWPAGQDRFADLSRSRREPCIAPRAREDSAKIKGKTERAARALPHGPRPADQFPLGRCPQNRSEGMVSAAAMRARTRLLAALSAEHLRHLARPYTLAGWTGADVLHALDYGPDGRAHGYSADVRSVAGWVRYRLSLWLDPQGAPLPSRSQRVQADRGRIQAEQSARRTEALSAAQRSAVVDVAAHAGRARALLAEARRQARE